MTADCDLDQDNAGNLATSMSRLDELIRKTEQYAAGNQLASRREAMKHLEGKHRGSGAKTEEQEDADIVQDEILQEEAAEAWPTHFDKQPSCIVGGQMRDYQLEALNWMIGLHDSGLNGILADEMGLGKTLQSISVLGYLKQYRDVKDPHIVIVPKSTLGNWVREFNKWCPSLRVLKFHALKDERAQLKAQLENYGSYDVVVTTYEMVSKEKGSLGKIQWHFMYIDEAHRIKNECSLLSQVVRSYKTKHRLLITGTPLQNNLHELWALLNFLLPNLFGSSEDFNDWFSVIESAESADSVVKRLHRVLRPFLLRRLKSDVETTLLPKIETILHVGLTAMQREWYTKLLMKDIDALNSTTGSRVRFLNLLMQLRKTCNHPYLFEGAEPGPPFFEGPHLIENAGKLVLLDKLLQRLHAKGSRVLIFSQMTRMLDIIEDYLRMKGHEYCRIDGQTSQDVREEMMDSFNLPDSPQFAFLLSTRAGGLGINLQTADTVILYDSDWNPQMDLQAQDRAHRIGQKKQVHVYRLVTEGTVEEKIVERAYKKLFLDALVIQQGRLASQANKLESKELSEMVRFGADQIFRSKESTVTDEDIDAIMEKGKAKTETITSTLQTNASFNLANFSLAENKGDVSIYNFDDKDFKELRAENHTPQNGFSFISMPKRDRKQVIEMDDYWTSQANPAAKRASLAERTFKPSARYDFQFFDVERIHELEQVQFEGRKKLKLLSLELKEKERVQKLTQKEGEKTSTEAVDLDAADGSKENEQTSSADQDQDSSRRTSLRRRSRSNTSESDPLEALLLLDKDAQMAELERLSGGLSELQKKELQQLEEEGFGNWKTREFQNFIRGSELFGRNDVEGIHRTVQSKSLEEVQRYHFVFWQRYKELRDWKKYIQLIERGEARLEKLESVRQVIAEKVAMHRNTMEDITFDYTGKNPMKGYTEEEDRFLFYSMFEHGYGNWEDIKASVRRSWMFRFDWFLKSRPAPEIGKRCEYLLTLATKDVEAMREASKSRKRKSSTGSVKRGGKKASVTIKRGRPSLS